MDGVAEETKVPQTGLKLYVDNTEVQTGTCAIRWCIDPVFVRHLAEHSTKSWLLISIVHGLEEVDRRLIPLKRMMAYFTFYRPGTHVLHASIVYTVKGGFFEGAVIEEKILQKSGSSYSSSPIKEDGSFNAGWISHLSMKSGIEFYATISSSLNIEVPSGVFGKEAPAWVMKWANLLFISSPRDECSLRKRIAFAFTIQPFGYVGAYFTMTLIKLIWAICALLFGIRMHRKFGVNWRAVFQWKLPGDVWDASCNPIHTREEGLVGGSWILYDRKGNRRPQWIVLLTPLIWISVWVISWIVSVCIGGISPTTPLSIAVGSFITTILLVFFVPFLGRWIWRGLDFMIQMIFFTEDLRTREAEKVRRRLEKEAKRRANKVTAMEKILKPLACETGTSLVSIEALPPERRTIILKYARIKGRFCRPLAQR